jgi:hypothetical protein
VSGWGMNPATPACQAVCVFALIPASIIWFCWECRSPFGIVFCHRNRPLWCLWRTKFRSSKPSVFFSVYVTRPDSWVILWLYICVVISFGSWLGGTVKIANEMERYCNA